MSDRIRIEIDEYGPAGADGYGVTIEQTPNEEPLFLPLVGHLLVTILRTTSAQAHPPTNLILAKKVLTWLARYRFPAGRDLSFFDPVLLTTVLAERTPPGLTPLARVTGSGMASRPSEWSAHRYGGLHPHPLSGHAEKEDWDPRDTLEGVNILAKQCLAGEALSHFRG